MSAWKDVKDHVKVRTAVLSEADVARIREQDGNRVYEDESVHLEDWQKLPAAEAARIAGDVRAAYLTRREAEPDRSDIDIRRDIVSGAGRATRCFCEHSHVRLFTSLTDRATNERHMGIIRHMFDVRTKLEAGELTPDAANTTIQNYVIKSCQKKNN